MVGGTLTGTDDRGLWNKEEAQLPINFLNESSQAGHRVVLQGGKTKTSRPTIRQRDSPVPLGENGTKKECITLQNFEENLGVLNCEQDHTYCRIPPKLSKHSGAL